MGGASAIIAIYAEIPINALYVRASRRHSRVVCFTPILFWSLENFNWTRPRLRPKKRNQSVRRQFRLEFRCDRHALLEQNNK